MKKLCTTLSLSTLLVVAACGGEEADVDEDNRNAQNMNNNTEYNLDDDADDGNDNEEDGTNNNGLEDTDPDLNDNETNEEAAGDENDEDLGEDLADDTWETEVGDTIENEGGVFTLHNRQDDIDTIETGPIIMDIQQVAAVSGELTGEMADFLETDELDYIQVDIQVENTADEDITFYAGQARMSTSTGEQLESDMWLSDHIDGEMMAGTSQSGSFFFVLENSNAEEVESVRLVWSAPHDEDWEDAGDEVDIEVEF
ncbi:hypothetical protein [Evansella clarkii]|uniref:hypothetical protein n=1 Tax=Evansella clarkii TaxID=79879 RepID=UPI000998AF3E|nr:hypothetical protein [Evansella clarkii]